MRKYLLAAALLASTAAHADVLDPLHGYEVTTTGNVNTDNGNITPVAPGDGWGFVPSQAPQTGDLYLAILVPNNYAVAPNEAVTGNMPGTSGAALGNWTSGTLVDFINGKLPGQFPNIVPASGNTLSSLAGPAATLDTGTFNGFNVYLINDSPGVGGVTLQDYSTSTMDDFANLPLGSEIVGFLTQGTGASENTIGTPSSGVLLPDPVPGPVAGAGLPGLVAAGLVLLGLARQRQNRLRAA
jgi:hypothetical protein